MLGNFFESRFRPLHLLDPVATCVRPIHVVECRIHEFVLVFVIFIVDDGIMIVVLLVILKSLIIEQVGSIRRPLVRANDELAQKLVAQRIEVFAVELCVLALFEI